jgi:asparagine synthase (glutamine-hydrolysing)
MPGIAGIIGAKPGVEGVRIVSAMLDALQHEPFYATGRLSAPELGVYAGWTAHPQSRAAEASAEKTAPHLSWMMAGECVGDGPSALTRYEQTGSSFVRDLNGIFSGLLVDRRKRQILLCNDRYGLERIYFHEAADGLLYFASEAKALLRVLPSTRAFDDEAIAQYLAFGCTHGVRSLFRGVGLLDGGTLWSFGEEGSRRERYITPATLEQQSPLDEEDFTEAFAAAFKAALPRYVGEGRELGISLTGGLDTRMIMACLPATTTRPVTYTFSGTQERTLDERIAAKVAATCGLEHRVLRIDHDFLANYGAFVDKTVLVTDGCFGATGAHEVYLNAKARELAPIRLTGNFGSESCAACPRSSRWR